MSLAHIKKHWLKYYVGTGVAWAGYSYLTYGDSGVVGIVENVALWPYQMYQTLTAKVSAPAAGMSISAGG